MQRRSREQKALFLLRVRWQVLLHAQPVGAGLVGAHRSTGINAGIKLYLNEDTWATGLYWGLTDLCLKWSLGLQEAAAW